MANFIKFARNREMKKHRMITQLRPWAKAVVMRCSMLLSLGLCALGCASIGHSQSLPDAAACSKLAAITLPDASITMAQAVEAGKFVMPAKPRSNMAPPPALPMGGLGHPEGPIGGPAQQQDDTSSLPAFCRVGATLHPTSDSNIKIEVWLPLTGWNGKYAAAGNSGWGGSLPYRSMVSELKDGYVVAGTDTGHDSTLPEQNGGAFLIGHPERFIDYAYRADHLMTLRAKDVVQAFYGKAARHSYWVGCSLGGEEALMEARRYPEDYDGIVAGAPVNPLSRLNSAQLWPAWVNYKFPEEAIPASKFVMIHDAALKACATPVGQKQGFIEDPENCHFQPASLLCKQGDGADCLTAPQVEMLKKLYGGPVNPRTGESIFPGMPVGGELQWAIDNGGAKPISVAVDLYKFAVYQNPSWDWKTMDYDKDIDAATSKVDPALYADPNLNEFLNRGGKLMLYIGWSEYHNANDLRDYYLKVLQNAGASAADSVRLFEVPGMGHCAGGAGCDTFEKIGVIDQWVETGKAPEKIVAAKMKGTETVRTRPLCAYPLIATYNGTGNEESAESYSCSAAKHVSGSR